MLSKLRKTDILGANPCAASAHHFVARLAKYRLEFRPGSRIEMFLVGCWWHLTESSYILFKAWKNKRGIFFALRISDNNEKVWSFAGNSLSKSFSSIKKCRLFSDKLPPTTMFRLRPLWEPRLDTEMNETPFYYKLTWVFFSNSLSD